MAGHVTVPSAVGDVQNAGGRAMGQHVPSTLADSGEIDLRGFFRILQRRKWMLLAMLTIAMAGSVFWVFRATPLYSADVLIVVEARPTSIVKVGEALQDASDDDAAVNTEMAVLESRSLAARVIEDLGLDQDRKFLEDLGLEEELAMPAANADGALPEPVKTRSFLSVVADLWGNAWSVLTSAWAGDEISYAQEAPIDGDPSRAEAVEAWRAAALLDGFGDRLTVEPWDESRLIRIGFTAADPQRAALIANTLVEKYMQNQLETKTEGARRAAEWLELRLAELGDTVRSLENEVQRQRAETGSDTLDIMSQRLAQINTQLVGARATAAAAHARYEQVRTVLQTNGNLDALPAVIASKLIQQLRTKHTELVRKLSELRTIYGERHPQIIAVRADIAQIERRLQGEIDNILAALRNEVESARIHERTLRKELEAVSREMIEIHQSEASIGQVAQRLRANQELYQSLLERHTEAVSLRDNQQPDARIISSAQIPLQPSYPNVPRMITLSFVGSTSIAIFVLVIVERLRQRLDTVEDVENHIGLQVIGTIPDLPRLRRATSAPRDYIQREPLSDVGGAFQRLRALLTLSNDRVMPRTVLVTSSAAGEGKTTVAVCLGIASISSGQRVLLVDCDFARPQVHRMLDLDNDWGLTDILLGTATVSEAINRTAVSHLSVLTVGRSPDGAVDLLDSARMEALLRELKEIFDIIILDSAPVQISNALILGGLAEKTIFVARREFTAHRKAAYAVKQLQLYGADIAGVVFNRAVVEASYD